jgi:hypothetical protein
MPEPGSHSYAAMRISRRSGIMNWQGNRAMTKNLSLAASMMILLAISGQALARSAAPNAHDWSEATGPTSRHMVRAFNTFDPAMAPQTVEPDAYRYHGGPKYND